LNHPSLLERLSDSVVVVMGKPNRSTLGSVRTQSAPPHSAQVVDLDQVRRAQERALTERRVRRVLEENRAALRRLFSSGLIFTQKGSRAGRDLLGAQLALLKLIDLLSRTAEHDFRSAASRLILAQLEAQLIRTAQLNARAGDYVGDRG
jgi:hypothetical protein